MARFSRFSQQGFVLASVSAACVLLAACGGGANPPVASLNGVAAVGAGLANAAVTAKCASGAPVVGTTAADGSFSLSLSGGQVAPCMLQVVGGTPSVTLHGFATDAGRVNITPLTDLVVTKALGTDPAIGFASFDAAKAGVVKAGLDVAKTYVNAQLAAIVGQSTALDIMTGFFKVGDADDKLLDGLAAAIAAGSKTLADLRLGAAQGLSLKPIIQVVPPVVIPPVVPPVVTPPVVTPPVVTPPVVTPPVVTPPVVTPPVVTPPVVTPPVVTPPVVTPPVVTPPVTTPPASGNECAPLVPKAGDSLSYKNTVTPGGTLSTIKYDYSSTTYLGQDALALTVTTTAAGTTSSSVTYTNAATGAYLGATTNGTTSTTVTTFDPPDYQNRINNAFYNIGQVATVAVKARVSGPDITTAFAAIGGGTALTMDYTFTVERKPNEALTVPAGTFANTCKLQVNVTINNVALEGNNGSNPLFSGLFPTISAAFTQPFKTTVWLTSVLPNIPKTFVDTTSAFAAGSSTQELTAYTLAPR